MKHARSVLLSVIMLGASSHFAGGATSPTLSVRITPKATDNFSEARFTLRVPEGVGSPSYILALVTGFNGDSDRMLRSRQWLEFAQETGGAMLACTFKKEKGAPYHYAAAQNGSGAALESAIERLDAKDASHSLKDLPLLIFGVSAGGQFAYGFSCHNPRRLIGFAAAKGGHYFPEPVEGTYEVPGLMISGHEDLARRRKAIRELFESHRAEGAPWCWMEDEIGHRPGECRSVVIPYFRELLRGTRVGQGEGFPKRPTDGGVWVDLGGKKVVAEGNGVDGRSRDPKRGWLPSRSVFDVWSRLDNGEAKFEEPVDPPEEE